jgi:signal transduction histidine kinase
MVFVTVLMQVAHGLYRFSIDIPLAQIQAEKEIARAVASIRPALSESLYQFNEELSNQLLKTFSEYESVQAVWMVDEEEEGISAWLRETPEHYDHWVELTWPILYQEETIGYLIMSAQWKSAQLRARQDVWNTIGFSVLMGVIALVSLYWVAQALVAQPISRMIHFLEQLNTRKFKEEDVVPLSEIAVEAELNILKKSLEDILIQLCKYLSEKQHTMELLQGFNENLELEVTKRTKELEIAKEKAESANRSKTDFLNTMTHELRTPLNSIMGFSSILMGKELPERLHTLVERIHGSGEHLLQIINDIMDYVSLEGEALQIQAFSVVDVLQGVHQDVIHMSNKKGLEYRQYVDDTLVLKGDPKRLNTLLRHLLENAVKFTENGYVSLDARSTEGEQVQFIVSDTGVGMDAKNIANLSHAFSQHEQGLNRSNEGVGLGLAIVTRICKKWNGGITFDSSDKGTVVTVTLPAKFEATHEKAPVTMD